MSSSSGFVCKRIKNSKGTGTEAQCIPCDSRRLLFNNRQLFAKKCFYIGFFTSFGFEPYEYCFCQKLEEKVKQEASKKR